jgi:hypothetical protein
MRETNLGILLGSLHQGVQNPTLKNYRTTLETGLRILELASYDLPVLNDIFKYNEGFNDLCSKVESYLTTNVHFNYYRFSKQDQQLKEDFNLDISKYDVRSLLILIRCNYIANGAYSIPTRRLIEDFETIDRLKKTTSLEAVKKALPHVSEKYITSRCKDKNDIKRSGEVTKILLSLLYLLSYDHQAFTYSRSEGRTYNSFTSLNKVYRENEMPFQLVELDIKSANPQIIDKIFGFDGRWKGVYSNLMSALKISRDEAKIKFNSTLNNHRLTVAQAKEVYLKAGYDPKESLILSEATANQKSGSWFKLMANNEGDIMRSFANANFKDDNFIYLHDAIYYEPEFTTISNAIELGISFGKSIIAKENLTLDLKLDTFKNVLSTPSTEQFIVKAYYGKSKVKQVLRTENFSWYSDNFLQLSATFDISKAVINDGIYRSPTENEFLERLMKLYKISTYLNNGNTDHFKTCIEHLGKTVIFNKAYIYAILPTWNFDINDALEYVKNRNWVYTGSSSLSLKDFSSLYHKERRQYVDKCNRTKLKQDLIRLTDAVENNQLYFIDKKKYHSAYTYEVGPLIDKIQELIGVKKRDAVKVFNTMSAFLRPHIKDKHMIAERCEQNISKPPVSRRLRKKIDIFNKEKPKILSSLNNAIENIDELHNIDQLFTPKHPTEMNQNHKYAPIKPATLNEAFGEPIDYTHSVYSNHTARTAMLQGKQFYINYSRFCRISELMKGKLWVNTNNYDSQIMAMDGLSIMLYNENYESILADSMSA